MWFYSKNNEQQGPVEAEVIRERLNSGDISNETLVWKEGMAEWTPLGQVSELRIDSTPATESPVTASVNSGSSDPYTPPGQAVGGMTQPQLIAPARQNSMALTSMILGILSFLCGGLLTGIPAIIFGHIARKQFRNSAIPQSGQGMATTGLILGYIATVISLLVLIGYVIVIVMAVNSSDPSSFSGGAAFPPPTTAP